MNEHYQSPRISEELGNLPIESAAERNALSRGIATDFLEQIDGMPIADLAKQYATPLFVFSEAKIREKVQRFRAAFKTLYPQARFAWSVKTNSLDAVCDIFKQEGWGAEVVSGYEYSKARAQGFKASEIIFNGPYKSIENLRRALEEGALVQIDNWDDLARVEEVAEELGGTFDVGIRVWANTGHAPVWSKFGFSFSNGEALQAGLRVIGHPNMRLHTLHTHIGTYLLDPLAYSVTAQLLLGLRDELHGDSGHLVPWINLGGGFPSYSLLHGMAGPAEDVVPPIESYAEAIASVLNRLPRAKRPQLRLETGRHLIDEAGYLVASIVAIKGGPPRFAATSGLSAVPLKEQSVLGEAAKLSYVIDAGINLLYTCAWFAFDAHPARPVSDVPVPTRLLGDLCMEIDVIRENVNLPHLQVGDYLTLHPVGAYNLGQSMQFIHLRPAVVMIRIDGTVDIIRRREVLDDMERAEHPDVVYVPAG